MMNNINFGKDKPNFKRSLQTLAFTVTGEYLMLLAEFS